MQALLFLVNTLLTLVVVAFLLRVLMPLVRADFRNPFGAAILKLTNPLVLPLRRLMRPGRRLDPASLVALLIVQFIKTALVLLIVGAAIRIDTLLIAGMRDLLSRSCSFISGRSCCTRC
jgi:YggT family protein